MTEAAPPSSDQPSSLVEAIIGKQNAHYQEKARELALRTALEEARHNKIRNNLGTVLIVMFTLTLLFGLSLGCLAMWNAVVG